MESNSVCNHTSDNKIGRLAAGVCFVYRDLLIKNYNYREKKKWPSYERQRTFVCTLILWLLSPRLLLVDFNYNFERDWPIELSNNNNLASELVESRKLSNQSQSRKLLS